MFKINFIKSRHKTSSKKIVMSKLFADMVLLCIVCSCAQKGKNIVYTYPKTPSEKLYESCGKLFGDIKIEQPTTLP